MTTLAEAEKSAPPVRAPRVTKRRAETRQRLLDGAFEAFADEVSAIPR